jgi:hypothetical protein
MDIEAVLFYISHYSFLIGVGILCYGMGRRLTQRVQFDSAGEQIAFCTTLGLGSLSYLVLLIGTLGLLHRWLILSMVGVIFLACSSAWMELFGRVSSAYKKRDWLRWKPLVLISLAIVIISPVLLLPLYPPTAFDSTMYHLACAKFYAQTGKIALTPYLRFPVFPQTNEMLFTSALLLYDSIGAQLIQFLMMLLISAGIFAFGRRHFSQRAGIWGSAIFLSNPMVLWLGASAYIDIGLALFVTMGTYSVFNWIDSKEKIWIVLGGGFWGFAAGSKYSALYFLILFGLVVLYLGMKERNLRSLFFFVAVTIGIASPWYFRNWYYTGNPVFPFFSQIFGYGLLSPQDLKGLLDDLIHAHGTGKGLGSLLLLPWNLAFNQPKFLMEAPLSKIYLFALPFLLAGLSQRKIRGLFLVLFSFALFWFSTAQVLRYLVPILPLLSLALGASFEHCLGLLPSGKVQWMKKGIVTFAISIALFVPGWLYTFHKVQNEDYPPATKFEQEFYLTQKLPSFPAYRYLNQAKGRNYSLYALFDENMAFFADGTFMGDWFGPGRFEKIYSQFSNLQGVHRELRSLGANYFLVRRGRVSIELPPEDFFLPSHFKLVYKNEQVLLFEIL